MGNSAGAEDVLKMTKIINLISEYIKHKNVLKPMNIIKRF
jgi:hypothetical protein